MQNIIARINFFNSNTVKNFNYSHILLLFIEHYYRYLCHRSIDYCRFYVVLICCQLCNSRAQIPVGGDICIDSLIEKWLIENK